MEKDAFTGGVALGGLWNKNDIRILLCYILDSVKCPLSPQDIAQITQERGLANYFEVADALSTLVKRGNVEETAEGFLLTPTGREIADTLDATLPLSVRDKALEAAFLLLASARSRRENTVEILPVEQGFQVNCKISGGQLNLMEISLYVPDEAQAHMVEQNFHQSPQSLYQLLLSSLTAGKGGLPPSDEGGGTTKGSDGGREEA